ncbi:MAG: hypothetical protein K2Q13_10295 [Nitrosomonas sp.]|uniref:hypothetical protein n=1 Tax=Nitrosomonas sp. TaxID=42353 RepID=UPI0025D47301|nr:hypothetical protein [Nitrosomonas sp.]MBY0475431.1 hypothetical protein [Nitrosomonas sp.]
MAAKPKLTQEEWARVRRTWESDAREGYAWLIDEMNIPISRVALRKTAIREKWTKVSEISKPETIKPVRARNAKAINNSVKQANTSKVSKVNKKAKVSKVNHVSETMSDEPETISETLEEPSEKEIGRPTLFREEYIKQVYRLSLLGTTDEEVAIYFNVSEQTVKNWMKEHPAFLASIQKGKLESDSKIARATYKSALGRHYVEEEKVVGNELVMARRQIPPDVSAQRMWLFNRRPKQWRNKIELKEDINLNVFPPKEELDDIHRRAMLEAAKRRDDLIARRERLGHIIDNDTGEVID